MICDLCGNKWESGSLYVTPEKEEKRICLTCHVHLFKSIWIEKAMPEVKSFRKIPTTSDSYQHGKYAAKQKMSTNSGFPLGSEEDNAFLLGYEDFLTENELFFELKEFKKNEKSGKTL